MGTPFGDAAMLLTITAIKPRAYESQWEERVLSPDTSMVHVCASDHISQKHANPSSYNSGLFFSRG